ncbi:MAG: class I SAM-dependent methyltransferase [Pseudomonadota bacterium]
MKPPKYFRITDYDKGLLPNPVLRKLEEGSKTPEDWQKSTGLSPGHPAWGIIYHITLACLHPTQENNLIETGTNWGSSSIVLAQAIRDSGRSGRLHTIEINPDNQAIAKQRVSEAGVDDLIEFHLGDSGIVIGDVADRLDSIRMAYLDGGHEISTVMDEFRVVERKLCHGGIVLMDNTYPITEETEEGRVSEALKEIVAEFGGNIINLPFVSWYTPGLAIWQRESLDLYDGLGL